MRVLHVIGGLSHDSGGPSRSVQGLVAGLNTAGIEAWLLSLNKGEEPWIDDVTHFVNGESFGDVSARIKPDIVHMHGIWSMALHQCVLICRRWKISYVIAPRGMLEPWSLQQKWLKKRIARWLYQDRDLKYAAALAVDRTFIRLGLLLRAHDLAACTQHAPLDPFSAAHRQPCGYATSSSLRKRSLYPSRDLSAW